MMLHMPKLTTPAIATGYLEGMDQPSIRVGTSAILRPWTHDDAPAVMEAFRDPSIQRWHIRRADSIDEARGWLTQWRDGWASESECHWAITTPETNELLGRIAAKGVNLWDGTAELAYWMTPAARGRGLCTQAVTALSEWAFREVGFHRLELAQIDPQPTIVPSRHQSRLQRRRCSTRLRQARRRLARHARPRPATQRSAFGTDPRRERKCLIH
ncbi:GNAT family N-acetyltransferase [Rhodococcus sp. IEGM 1241]|uniref:GNAT family N-acetyltransferase n=1 Tax=Rhodococcus sp. IEGM 1241 TaxID=3082228 RepID=UPI002954F4A3|nr:GNAT family N-acetyltransferase [Rhodococcus sp. IEGM 1241]MDV8011063.1 GNAT family N-acetyltransferase [Rhodococcus sp. IEGM 1241]